MSHARLRTVEKGHGSCSHQSAEVQEKKMVRQRRRVLKLCLTGWGVLLLLFLWSFDVEAVSINWGTAGNPIYGENGVGSETLERGDIVQLICDRACDGINPPGVDGLPTGDDELIHESYIGHGSFFEGEFSDNITTGSVGIGDFLYVRAWNDSLLASAARWGDTDQHTPKEWVVDNGLVFTLNATENGPWATVYYKLRTRSKKYEDRCLGILENPGRTFELADGVVTFYGARPNPFRDSSVLGFEAIGGSSDLSVGLKIYDVRGSLVRNLLFQTVARGEQWISWDGRDDGGAKVGSGVYLCRLEIRDGENTLTLIAKLLRLE